MSGVRIFKVKKALIYINLTNSCFLFILNTVYVVVGRQVPREARRGH